ncbi:MAG: hypothetical protein K0R57_2699 [Paenibacillaceae bacterium]|jgi:hypothetical protein|nr:hypothetical protein [Paenibacillaceae bacterium]
MWAVSVPGKLGHLAAWGTLLTVKAGFFDFIGKNSGMAQNLTEKISAIWGFFDIRGTVAEKISVILCHTVEMSHFPEKNGR